jgi:hypothetical protein
MEREKEDSMRRKISYAFVKGALSERNKFVKEIENEKHIVKLMCVGLMHPDQRQQEDFTRWLQNTVIFHLNNLKRRIRVMPKTSRK